MTRAKISEYSATANDNTDVNGINIAEGCPPSSMNNMGREIMAALKRFQVGSDGDGVTVGGSLVVSGSTSVNTFNVDVISEKTSAAGVTVDGVLLKDSQVSTDQINEKTSAAGVTIDGVLLKDSGVVTGAGTVSAPVYSTTGDLNTGIFFPAADTIAFAEGGAEAMRIDSSGNVGIGLSPFANSLGKSLDIVNGVGLFGSGNNTYLSANAHYDSDWKYKATDEAAFIALESGSVRFNTAPSGTAGNNITFTERARIDSSGNLLVGQTTQSGANAGCALTASGQIVAARSAADVMYLNRITNDGTIINFAKDNSTVGVIGCNNSRLYIGSGDTGLDFEASTDAVRPMNTTTGAGRDNAIDLGRPDVRFRDAYITDGVTTGSDRNDKQDIEELSEAETRVAVACKALLRKWRWKDAVTEKGDDARVHFGIIAQDLKAAFEAEGLDAGRYAMFIHSAWWEKERVIPAVEAQEAIYETQTDEDGNEIRVLVSEAVEAKPERTVTDTFETEAEAPEGAVRKERMGVRYNELLAFMVAAL